MDGDLCLNGMLELQAARPRRGRVVGRVLFAESIGSSEEPLLRTWPVVDLGGHFNGYCPHAFLVDVVDARFPRTCRAHEEEQCRQ